MIDLRSDTVTQPCDAMRKCMANARVGDDVWGDDPSVNELESLAAEMLDKPAALFLSSGTQSNLAALLTHCQRGEEYIVGQDAHTYKYEGGGAAVLGGIQPQPLTNSPDGTLDLEQVRKAIKPDDPHFAISRLLCLENTINGRVLGLDYLSAARQLASECGLKHHLDGARVFNAAVVLEEDVKAISQCFDSVSVCLSKGLGAPVGSVLCGEVDFIHKARRWRKMLGGGMRQAGIVAAAGIYALQNNVADLAEDHEHARMLGEALNKLDEVEVKMPWLQSNMVFFNLVASNNQALADWLGSKGILVDALGADIRLVTHRQVSRQDVEQTIKAIKDYLAS